MNTLRWSLLIIGLCIIAIVYIRGRIQLGEKLKLPEVDVLRPLRVLLKKLKSRIKSKTSMDEHEDDNAIADTRPQLELGDIEALGTIVAKRDALAELDEPLQLHTDLPESSHAPHGEELVISLAIMARTGGTLSGEAIQRATTQAGFEFGTMQIYHKNLSDSAGHKYPVVNLANLLEPGTFDLQQMHDFSTPGLLVFIHLPCEFEARIVFDELIASATRLAELLAADLCDDTRSVLTRQTIGHLKEKVEAYRFKQKMALVKQRRTTVEDYE